MRFKKAHPTSKIGWNLVDIWLWVWQHCANIVSMSDLQPNFNVEIQALFQSCFSIRFATKFQRCNPGIQHCFNIKFGSKFQCANPDVSTLKQRQLCNQIPMLQSWHCLMLKQCQDFNLISTLFQRSNEVRISTLKFSWNSYVVSASGYQPKNHLSITLPTENLFFTICEIFANVVGEIMINKSHHSFQNSLLSILHVYLCEVPLLFWMRHYKPQKGIYPINISIQSQMFAATLEMCSLFNEPFIILPTQPDLSRFDPQLVVIFWKWDWHCGCCT